MVLFAAPSLTSAKYNFIVSSAYSGAANSTIVDAGKLDTIVDGAEKQMQMYCDTNVAAGTSTSPTVIEMDTEKLCRNFVMAADTQATSHWELHFEEHAHRRRLSGEDVFVAIFAEHDLHAEFESTASG